MTNSEIQQEILNVLTPFVRDRDALRNAGPETQILKDLKVNSSRLVDIIIGMEDAFGIEIQDGETEQIVTLEKAVQLVQRKKGAANPV